MIEVEFKLEGLRDLEQQLLKLGAKVSGAQLRGALSDSIKPMQKEAKSLAPRAQARLRKSIRRTSRFNKKTGATAKLVAGGRKKGQPFRLPCYKVET